MSGTIVLPVVIGDCEIPFFLRDRVYADFRAGYREALQKILQVLRMENGVPIISRSLERNPLPGTQSDSSEIDEFLCILQGVHGADLRRPIGDLSVQHF